MICCTRQNLLHLLASRAGQLAEPVDSASCRDSVRIDVLVAASELLQVWGISKSYQASTERSGLFTTGWASMQIVLWQFVYFLRNYSSKCFDHSPSLESGKSRVGPGSLQVKVGTYAFANSSVLVWGVCLSLAEVHSYL